MSGIVVKSTESLVEYCAQVGDNLPLKGDYVVKANKIFPGAGDLIDAFRQPGLSLEVTAVPKGDETVQFCIFLEPTNPRFPDFKPNSKWYCPDEPSLPLSIVNKQMYEGTKLKYLDSIVRKYLPHINDSESSIFKKECRDLLNHYVDRKPLKETLDNLIIIERYNSTSKQFSCSFLDNSGRYHSAEELTSEDLLVNLSKDGNYFTLADNKKLKTLVFRYLKAYGVKIVDKNLGNPSNKKIPKKPKKPKKKGRKRK